MAITLIKQQQETVDDILRLLIKYGRCACVRPTGFGKTVLSAVIAAMGYKRVLYFYPTNIIQKGFLDNLELVELDDSKTTVKTCSYTYAGSLHKREDFVGLIVSFNPDLIIFDEIHNMGANLTELALTAMFEEILHHIEAGVTHVLGLTGTDIRMDRKDVVDTFFGNVTTYKYTLDDAVADGLLQEPLYTTVIYGDIDKLPIEQERDAAKKTIALLRDKSMKNNLQIQLDADTAAICNPINLAEDVLVPRFHQVYGDNTPKYMKMLVFFRDKETMHSEAGKVAKWFTDAFGLTANIVKVMSEYEYSDIDRVAELQPREGYVDIICSIDMLTEGYHAKDITGVIFLRGTQSYIVYVQQLGRALSVNSRTGYQAIVFDLVNNIEAPFLFTSPNSEQLEGRNINYENRKEKETRMTLSKPNFVVDPRLKAFKDVRRKADMELTKQEESDIIELASFVPALSIKHIVEGYNALGLSNGTTISRVMEVLKRRKISHPELQEVQTKTKVF